MGASSKRCSAPFAFTPAPFDYRTHATGPTCCTHLDGVMNRTNYMNVPFDNQGYLESRSHYHSALRLPVWPSVKPFPTVDVTNSLFCPVPTPDLPLDMYRDATTVGPLKSISGSDSLRGHRMAFTYSLARNPIQGCRHNPTRHLWNYPTRGYI